MARASRLSCRPVPGARRSCGRRPQRFRIDLPEFFCVLQMETAPFRGGSRHFRTIHTGATAFISTSTSMATMGLALERVTRPDGLDSSPSSLNKAARECSWPSGLDGGSHSPLQRGSRLVPRLSTHVVVPAISLKHLQRIDGILIDDGPWKRLRRHSCVPALVGRPK
jgi:hypothetical protein